MGGVTVSFERVIILQKKGNYLIEVVSGILLKLFLKKLSPIKLK